ncbi:IS605 family transposase OrfB [Sphingopyxis fribergensis]|uniref:IS605 family transposase OrfB n=1 Tax=Sphingopyxis fribergensis TaxID=1515612 RepID=A0A0A7PBZ7_9SPHN|nr:RNA-guided endonuclease TnpB family protein [Sphingopyxis fribergensis]AJA07484.1 IS605 family transposase OrfB [Sphingopyxis fribergensis]
MAEAGRITIKVRLRDKHSALLNRQAAAVNLVWNYCNEISRKAWSRDRRWLSKFDIAKLTAGSSAELGLHSHTIMRTSHEFAKSRDKAKRAGLRWRSRKSLGWVPFNTGHAQVISAGQIKFKGVIFEAMHWRDELQPGVKIGAGSFNCDARGRWYFNAPIEVGCDEPTARPAVGIDLGLKDLATLSDGGKIEAPRLYRASEAALATSQRARKAPKRIRNIHAKIANRRKDHLHKASAAIAKKYGTIVVGDVSAKRLAQTKMAKSVNDAGWSMLRDMLSYKALRHGGRYIVANERMSTQTCSECGSIPPSRPKGIAGLGIRGWECSDCGTVHDRDVNAARNILRVGLDALAEGAGA